MATEHLCDGKWVPGRVAECSKHERNQDRRPIRWGKKARARMDREAGVRGVDRGGFISG